MKDLTLLTEELEKMGKAECPACKKGMLRPLNPDVKINHYYECDNCGEQLIITPNVIVD